MRNLTARHIHYNFPKTYGKFRTYHTKSAIIGDGSVTHVRMDHETEK